MKNVLLATLTLFACAGSVAQAELPQAEIYKYYGIGGLVYFDAIALIGAPYCYVTGKCDSQYSYQKRAAQDAEAFVQYGTESAFLKEFLPIILQDSISMGRLKTELTEAQVRQLTDLQLAQDVIISNHVLEELKRGAPGSDFTALRVNGIGPMFIDDGAYESRRGH